MRIPTQEEKAVSEIIGAILLFAIVSVLLTSFILWYVPSTANNNEMNYQMGTQSSLISLDAKMLNPDLEIGNSISENVPMGIAGTPPFIPAKGTEVFYNSNFNASLSYSLMVNYSNQIHKNRNSVVSCANSSAGNIMNNKEVSSLNQYKLDFRESGLNSGIYWKVKIDGISKASSPLTSTSSKVLSFCLPRGKYSYRVGSDSQRLEPNPKRGIVLLNSSSTSISVNFNCNANKSLVAANFGEGAFANPVNLNHITPAYGNRTGNSGIKNKSVCLNDWLGNSGAEKIGSTIYYPMSSQQFTVQCAFEPVNYIEFMLQPNLEYRNQFFQGNSSLYVNIGKSMWGSGLSGSGVVKPLKQNESGSAYSNGNVLEKLDLKNCICLGTQRPYVRTYYLNFWESVNESAQSSKAHAHVFGIRYDNESKGYGYGPNEFLATACNQPFDVGVQNAYGFSAGAVCNVTGENSYNCFNITSDHLNGLSQHIYFAIGFTGTSGSCVLHVHENGLSKKELAGNGWNITIGGKSYIIKNNEYAISDFCNFQYSFCIQSAGNLMPGILDGFISIHVGYNSLNVTFLNPEEGLPANTGISDKGIQCVKVSNVENFNYVSMYFFNFQVPSNDHPGYVKVSLYNLENGSKYFKMSRIVVVDSSGFYNVHFKGNSTGNQDCKLVPGKYFLCAQDVNENGTSFYSGHIGWGFVATGGFDNYIHEIPSDMVSKSKNNTRNSIITPYYAVSPCLIRATNQTFIYSIGYRSKDVISNNFSKVETRRMGETGSIFSTGTNGFGHTGGSILEDGMVLSTGNGDKIGAGGLPLCISNDNTGISLSSRLTGMRIKNGIPTSESNTGSTYLSLTENHRIYQDLKLFHNYSCGSETLEVTGLTLLKYNYTIKSHYANIFGSSFYNELAKPDGTENNFTEFNLFSFTYHHNEEKIVNAGKKIKISSFSYSELGFMINSV